MLKREQIWTCDSCGKESRFIPHPQADLKMPPEWHQLSATQNFSHSYVKHVCKECFASITAHFKTIWGADAT